VPDHIRVKLTPTTVHLTPSATGTFTSAVKPGKGSFPVVVAVEVSLEERGAGAMPAALLANTPPRARLEILVRQRVNNPAAPYTLCGTFNGTMSLLGAARTPTFIAKRPGTAVGQAFVTDFTPNTAPGAPDIMTRSDWSIRLNVDGTTLQIANGDPLVLRIPWIFDPTNAFLQLNARLSINSTIETDVNSAAANPPIEIPLQHDKVPDEAVANKVAEHPLLSFFGVHTLSTMSRERTLPAGLSSAGLTVNVFVDDTVLALVPAANTGQLRTHVITVLQAAGFATVNVELAAAAPPTPPGQTPPQTVRTRFAALFVQARVVKSLNLWFMSRNVPEARRVAIATKMEANGDPPVILAGETVQIPFFDFFICAQNIDPPKGEVGHSEIIDRVVGANPRATPPVVATKAILAPIVITAGSNSQSGMRKMISTLGGEQTAQLVASTICHEIGHTLGLRHVVSFQEALPHVFADVQCRSVMGAAVAPPAPPPPTVPPTPPVPFEFFSPVQMVTIRQNYL